MQSFEICTQIGCCVKCLKYCPQELIEANYKGTRILTLTEFKKLTSTIPTDVLLAFSGISEPFQNQECADMIRYANLLGYTIRVFTTLTGLKPKTATSILDIPFERFILHLPDAEGNAKIPITSDYLEVLGRVLTHVRTIEFMNMGSSFVSFKQEDVFRNKPVTTKNYLLPQCANLRTPNYMMLYEIETK